MQAWTFDSRGPEETREAGRELGRSIGIDGLVIALIGPLGAGKTVFVKGLAEGLGIDPRVVSSPTFVIAQQYPLPGDLEMLHHVDLYRLESEHELEAIGFYDMFAPGTVLAAEWADRFPGVLGRETLTIELEGPGSAGSDDEAAGARVPEASGPDVRRARVRAQGRAAGRVLEDWAERWQRLRSRRPGVGAGSLVEMRLAATLVLALALFIAPRLATDGAPLGLCEALHASVEDALGTSHAECAPSGSAAGALSGVGRILSGGRIDLNAASPRLLETLPGIGPARAQAIAQARDARPFERVADLERVHGIGPKTVARLARWLEVAAPGTAAGTRIDASRPPAERAADEGRRRG